MGNNFDNPFSVSGSQNKEGNTFIKVIFNDDLGVLALHYYCAFPLDNPSPSVRDFFLVTDERLLDRNFHFSGDMSSKNLHRVKFDITQGSSVLV